MSRGPPRKVLASGMIVMPRGVIVKEERVQGEKMWRFGIGKGVPLRKRKPRAYSFQRQTRVGRGPM